MFVRDGHRRIALVQSGQGLSFERIIAKEFRAEAERAGLSDEGTPVFFTIDAGPQLKAVCAPDSSDRVAAALAEIPGVVEVVRCGLGDGARVVEA